MQGGKDSEVRSLRTEKYDIAILTDIGDRDEQQDNYGLEVGDQSAFFVVCDGMGGYRGGREASHAAVNTILEEYLNQMDGGEPISFLQKATKKADQVVSSLRDRDGKPLGGGSTMITVLLYRNYLYWNSVGDSRIYLIRSKNEYAQVTQDQNYRTVINEQLRTGVITREEYEQKNKKANALINYLGIGNIQLIDYNSSPFKLTNKDKILMTTDGLFRLLNDKEIAEIVHNYEDVNEALAALAYKVRRKGKILQYRRDNLTMLLINIL